MIVWYISSGKVFDEAVIESLKNTALGLVEVLDQLEFLTKFTGLCMESSSRKFQLSIVMDVDCTIGMQSLLKVRD